jgi:hypothetical protein
MMATFNVSSHQKCWFPSEDREKKETKMIRNLVLDLEGEPVVRV